MSIRPHLLASVLAVASLSVACKGKPSCDDVVDHTLGLMPAELKSSVGGDKKPMIEKCEKEMNDDQRACVMKASTMEEMMKCK